MSDKMPYYDLNRKRLTVKVPVETCVQLEKVVAARRETQPGISLSEICEELIVRGVKDVPLTPEDYEKAATMVRENEAKRELAKQRKGIK